MEKKTLYSRLPDALLPWYDAHHRDLPWRENKDPYHIWVSEIMLQQTRVEAVKGYYARFCKCCPRFQLWRNAMTILSTSCGRVWAIITGCGI